MNSQEYNLWLTLMELCHEIAADAKLANEANQGHTSLIFGEGDDIRSLTPESHNDLLTLKYRLGEAAGGVSATNRILALLEKWHIDFGNSASTD